MSDAVVRFESHASHECRELSNQPQAAKRHANSSIRQESGPLMDWESGLVGWESPTDRQNPRNWSAWKKRHVMAYMSTISTLSPMASTMVAPGISLTLKEFSEPSQTLGSFMVTIYVLGFVIGPLFLAPLSEIYGRYPVVVLSTWSFNVWILGSSFAPTMSSLIVMRFLAGIGGSAVMTIAPAIVGDLYPVEQRGFASSVLVLTQCLGPAIGPICGGFIAQDLGWRWTYWVLVICAGTLTVLMTLFMPESYAPRILQTKARRMQRETGRTDLHTLLNQKSSTKEVLIRSIARPIKMLTTSPIVFSICAYMATMYGFLYLLFTTIPTVFEKTYGWSTSLVGLAYTPLAIGMMAALCLLMKTSDATVIKLTRKNNNVFEPEMRLPDSKYYAAFLPVSLFWYGWTAEKKVHWIVPILGLVPFGWGNIGVYMPCQTYLVDAFPDYAASAVAACRASLSIFGAFFPLIGPALYNSLGFGWGNTVLGLIGVAILPIPIVLYKYGGRMRQRHPNM